MADRTLDALRRDEAYRVVRVLADGPTGTTELVCAEGDPAGGLLVRKRTPSSIANRRAWEEARKVACARLPRVVEAYELPDQLVTVTRRVEGPTLREAVAANGPMAAGSALRVAGDVCEALEALHARGIVHRDVTPANIVLSSDGAVLIDLDNARVASRGSARDTNTLGTWGYAPPEQYGFAPTDARSDIYSLGRVLAFAATGVEPLDAAAEARMRQALSANPQLAEVAKVVEHACSFEPSTRFQYAFEMRSAINGKWLKHPRDPRYDAKWRVALQGVVWGLMVFWACALAIGYLVNIFDKVADPWNFALTVVAVGGGGLLFAWLFSRFIRGRGAFGRSRHALVLFLVLAVVLCAAVTAATFAVEALVHF